VQTTFLQNLDHPNLEIVVATVLAVPSARAVADAFTAAMNNGKQFTGRFTKPRPAEVLFERVGTQPEPVLGVPVLPPAPDGAGPARPAPGSAAVVRSEGWAAHASGAASSGRFASGTSVKGRSRSRGF